MKSARINFGIPESEYILEVDDSGAATSLVNQDTDTEYIGGGSDVLVTPDYADLAYAYVVSGQFNQYSTNKYYLYLFTVTGGKSYTLAKTDTSGNNFNSAYFAGKTLADFESTLTHGGSTATIYTGVQIMDVANNSASAVTYKPASDGVIVVQVSSQSQAAKMACVDMSEI